MHNEFLEEIRREARANAESRGYTLEEQIDALERVSGAKDYFNALRVLYGILSYEEVWGPR